MASPCRSSGSDGVHINFGRVDELPPTDKSEEVVSQLYCEAELTAEQVGQATTIMQTQADRGVPGRGQRPLLSCPTAASTGGGWQTPIGARVVRDHRIRDAVACEPHRAATTAGRRASRNSSSRRMATMRHSTAAILASVAERIDVVAPIQTTGASTPRVTRMSLGAADNSGVGAYYPTDSRTTARSTRR